MAYSTVNDLNQLHGETNVSTWADMDEDGDSAAIAARIAYMIAKADSEIDDRLRGSRYQVGNIEQRTSTAPPDRIVWASAVLAGVLLYENHGVADFDPKSHQPAHQFTWRRQNVYDVLEQIRNGSIQLDAKPSA